MVAAFDQKQTSSERVGTSPFHQEGDVRLKTHLASHSNAEQRREFFYFQNHTDVLTVQSFNQVHSSKCND